MNKNKNTKEKTPINIDEDVEAIPAFEPLAPTEDDILEEISLMGTFLND